jgi:hypothetical protein
MASMLESEQTHRANDTFKRTQKSSGDKFGKTRGCPSSNPSTDPLCGRANMSLKMDVSSRSKIDLGTEKR